MDRAERNHAWAAQRVRELDASLLVCEPVLAETSRQPPREKLLSDYVLLIPKSRLEDTLKPRAELLEKKPDAGK